MVSVLGVNMRHILRVLGVNIFFLLLYCGHAQDAVLTTEPNWSTLFTGESVTFICDMREGKDTDWYYAIWKDGGEYFPFISHKRTTLQPLATGGSGEYQCIGDSKVSPSTRKKSNKVSLTVSAQPKARLSKNVAGGKVTLTCSVNPSSSSSSSSSSSTSSSSSSSSGWNYFWYRGQKTSEPLTTQDVLSNEMIRVSVAGVYWCRGGRGEPVYYTEYSDPVVTYRAVVTLQPNWSEIYAGETITLKCDIEDGGDTEWEYEWITSSNYKPQKQKEYMIRNARSSDSGDYRCLGRLKGEQAATEWSDAFTLRVSDNWPVLTVSPSWLSPGASVTLSCSVKDPSAGWRFYWYKAVPDLSHISYSYELLPGSTTGTEQETYIVDGQTHTAGYVCRAARGDPVVYTSYSGPMFVWSRDVHPAASLTVSPDRSQHFGKESLSLSCEGDSTKWRVKMFTERSFVFDCSFIGTMNGFTCNIDRYWVSGVYWCESDTGQISNAVNITMQHDDIILVSPVLPVVEGHSVTLGCKLKTENVLYNVDFYKNDKLIQNNTNGELTISAVSKSDEGFYKCEGNKSPGRWRNLTSKESWMSVTPTRSEETSPFPVLLIVGPVCGVLLIPLLLMFLYRYRKSNDSCFSRSQSTNQIPATDHMINQVEAQYASLLHGDACLYETIKGPEEPEHGRNEEPEDSLYYNVMIGSAAAPVL